MEVLKKTNVFLTMALYIIKVNNTFVEINGKRRYFGKDGKAVMDGEIEIDGRKYVFKDGYVVKE